MVKQNQNIGSSFDDFLIDEGILEETESVATKRVGASAKYCPGYPVFTI